MTRMNQALDTLAATRGVGPADAAMCHADTDFFLHADGQEAGQ